MGGTADNTERDGSLSARNQPQLLGRDSEMSRFHEILTAGHGGVVLHGAAGAGKTRLAEELVTLAETAGFVGRFVRGRHSVEGLPLGPFAALLPVDIERTQGVSLLLAARTAIQRLGGERPLVLGVDDAHLLDPASASVVNQLVVTGAVILVSTVRDDEWVPDPITELWRTGQVARWHVGTLDPEHVIALAETLLGRSMAPDMAEQLVRLTGGNPLFVATLARAMADAGPGAEIEQAANMPTLVDFVSARLDTLAPTSRDALCAVALVEPIGLTLLEEVAEPSALIDLERNGWLSVVESGLRTEVRLAHPLFGEVLRRSLSRLLARSIYREFADAIIARGARRRDDAFRIAYWSLESGTPVASDTLMAGAEHAIASGDAILAEQFAESVWDSERRLDAGLLLHFLHRSPRVQVDPDRFVDELHAAAATPLERARVHAARSFDALWRRGDLDGAMRSLDDGLACTAEEPDADAALPVRVGLMAQQATTLAFCARTDASRTILAEIDALQPDLPTRTANAAESALAAHRLNETVHGDLRRLVTEFDAGRPASDPAGDASAQAAHIGDHWMCRALLQAGQGRRAEQLARAAVEAGGDDLRTAGTLSYLLGWTLVWRGRPVEAYRWAHRAAALQRRFGYATLERWSRQVMGMAAAMAGELDDAEACLAQAEALGPSPATAWDAEAWNAHVVIATLRSDRDTAVSWARRGIAESVERGMWFDEALGWHILARLGEPAEAAAALEPLADRLGGVAAIYLDHARAASKGDHEGEAAAAERFALAGIDAVAASVMAVASRSAAERGDTRGAQRIARRARELAAGIDNQGRIAVGVPPVPLTGRELDVARLAAEGSSSREIAAATYLSVRTVDNHLASAYDKLGVSGRDELAAALAAMPTPA